MTTGNGPTYRVDMSSHNKNVLKSLHLQAAEKGTGTRFVAAFRTVVDHLRREPLTFGEPLYRLELLRLQIRQAVVDPLVVVYGVHEDKALVIIRNFKVLP
jgi:hypothetical protein